MSSKDFFSTECITEAVDKTGSIELFTVPLLLKLLELFCSEPANAFYITNVFLGADLPDVRLEGMTLSKGREAAKMYRDILIHIDEVPMWNKIESGPFVRCLLLRNIIRLLGLPCLLSGTESTLLDVVDYGKGSRTAGSEPWAWLMTRFPVTELSEPLKELIQCCKDYERQLLLSTRPLFVQWFAYCHKKQLTGTDALGRICITPAALTRKKRMMVVAKQSHPEDDNSVRTTLAEDCGHHWLHASTLLVFADSLHDGSEEVTSTVVPSDSTAQIGAKRLACSSQGPSVSNRSNKKQKIAGDVHHHSLVIRKHFALLYIPPGLAINNGMAKLIMDGDIGGLRDTNGISFHVKAAFKTCTADPLLYLAGLRDGIVRYVSATEYVSVPSSYAFTTFRQRGVGNRLAKSNDGTALEAECMAALVLAAHRYESFRGTPFFHWLALVIAELSHKRVFEVTKITNIPEELDVALKDVMVPLLSPPNSPWGESLDSGINFGNFSWCKNQEQRDASAPLSNTEAMAMGSAQRGEEEGGEGEDKEEDLENHLGQFSLEGALGYIALGAEFKDVDGFGGKNMAAVTRKVAENSVSLLIGRNLCDWKAGTVLTFDQDVSVYRMNERGSIMRVSPEVAEWKAGRKVLIALDLKRLHPGRVLYRA